MNMPQKVKHYLGYFYRNNFKNDAFKLKCVQIVLKKHDSTTLICLSLLRKAPFSAFKN